ncbi:methyltransferase family protein [Chloroflexota bacterium]
MNDFFDYFQIVVLIFFLLIFMGRTLYLRFARGVKPITLGVGKQGLQRLVELSFFVGLVLWIVEIVLHATHAKVRIFPALFYVQLIDSPPDSLSAKFVGMAVIILGFIIFIWALASFGDSWRVGIDLQSPGELVTTGMFALSRNPIFVFIDLYFVGAFLINGTPIFLVFAVLVLGGLHYQILQEEKFLTNTYGDSYQRYFTRTGRYLLGF